MGRKKLKAEGLAFIMVYTDRVQDVLEYVQKNPINIQSERMFYVPTSELDSKRLPEVVEGLDTIDVLIERKSQENRINVAPIGKAEEHMAEVAVAMLYFACGGMDESHNIVLPHSWPPTESIEEENMTLYMSGRSPIQGKEGDIIGELGNQGFSNCKFRFGKTGYHPLY